MEALPPLNDDNMTFLNRHIKNICIKTSITNEGGAIKFSTAKPGIKPEEIATINNGEHIMNLLELKDLLNQYEVGLGDIDIPDGDNRQCNWFDHVYSTVRNEVYRVFVLWNPEDNNISQICMFYRKNDNYLRLDIVAYLNDRILNKKILYAKIGNAKFKQIQNEINCNLKSEPNTIVPPETAVTDLPPYAKAYRVGWSRGEFQSTIKYSNGVTVEGRSIIDMTTKVMSPFTITHIKQSNEVPIDYETDMQINHGFCLIRDLGQRIKYDYLEHMSKDRDVTARLGAIAPDCGEFQTGMLRAYFRNISETVRLNLSNRDRSVELNFLNAHGNIIKLIVEATLFSNEERLRNLCVNTDKEQTINSVMKIIPSKIPLSDMQFFKVTGGGGGEGEFEIGEWISLDGKTYPDRKFSSDALAPVDMVAPTIIMDSGNDTLTYVGEYIVNELNLPIIDGCKLVSVGVSGHSISICRYVKLRFKFAPNSPYYNGKEYELYSPVDNESASNARTILFGHRYGLYELFNDGYIIVGKYDIHDPAHGYNILAQETNVVSGTIEELNRIKDTISTTRADMERRVSDLDDTNAYKFRWGEGILSEQLKILYELLRKEHLFNITSSTAHENQKLKEILTEINEIMINLRDIVYESIKSKVSISNFDRLNNMMMLNTIITFINRHI